MEKFSQEFYILNYIIRNSRNVLLVAHSRPDGDALGSVMAMKEYLKSLGKQADIACFHPIPEYLRSLTEEHFYHPDQLDFAHYDSVIACDSVERGFHEMMNRFREGQVKVLIDHHPDISLEGDLNIIDASYCATCEIIYNFFKYTGFSLTKNIATYLMIGILSDTGNFRHSNTTSRIMGISSELMKKGAPLSKITDTIFSNKKISTLKLWGKAFEKAKINPRNGMIVTVLTQEDIDDCNASGEDVAEVASILNTVPGTKFSLILSEREQGVIKGSLRSEEYKGADVSSIAHIFGGGGHKLASGFEIQGRILETESGWEII